MRALLVTLVTALVAIPAAAQSLVVYPFDGGEAGLGALLADRVAEAYAPAVDEVVGPAVAPGLVPPVAYDGGYLNPTAFLGDAGVASLHGATVARSALGADLLVTGRMSEGDPLRLEAFAVEADGRTARRTFTASPDDPGELASDLAWWLAPMVGAAPTGPLAPIDLSGEDGVTARALALVGGGFLEEAETLLTRAEESDELSARARALQDAVAATRAGEPTDDPALGAVLSLSTLGEDGTAARSAFGRYREAGGLPAALAWSAALAHSDGDRGAAEDAAAAAADAYPYGAAVQAGLAADLGTDRADALLGDLADGADAASLLVASAWAETRGEPERQRRALEALTRRTPTFVYPFERLSFLAFDRDDGLAAAQALAVAVELQPDSGLYWTNLGWSWYLLGFWDRSEEASLRALELEPSQVIAAYNLGLVRARQGRLEAALEPYEQALEQELEVNDEALADVENAIEEVPDEPALRFVYGRLLEADGRRADASAAYRAALDVGGLRDPYAEQAAARAERLAAPPPPMTISGAVDVALGISGRTAGPWHPGDPVTPEFELTTPGEALPRLVEVALALRDGDGEVRADAAQQIEIPANAIGFVVDTVSVDLPDSLPAGSYELEIRATAPDREATVRTEVEVEGGVRPLRQLVGRGVRLDDLDDGRALFDASDLGRADTVVDRLVSELRDATTAAEEALPTVEAGRFAGLTGGAVFAESDAGDVRDFLRYLAADEELRDTRITFVDAYAQWAVEGAETP